MRSATTRALILSALSCLGGCNGGTNPFTTLPNNRELPTSVIAEKADPQDPSLDLVSRSAVLAESETDVDTAEVDVEESVSKASDFLQVGYETEEQPRRGSITIDGKTYGIQLIAQSDTTNESTGPALREIPPPPGSVTNAPYETDASDDEDAAASDDGADSDTDDAELESPIVVEATDPNALLLNLPSALAMIDGQHPAVGFARWKIQEAYANLDQAEALWLPSIQTGFSFHRHDGNYQASNGDIVDVHRNSFQFGFGAGATGAGTTPRQGLQAQFHLADALFQPGIARTTAWAADHAEKSVVNRKLRDAATGYMRLLDAHQQLRILNEVKQRTVELKKITTDFAEAGEGLQADADRMQTELTLVEARIASAREAVDVISVQLTEILSADTYQNIVPLDSTVTPIDLVDAHMDRGSLISNGLHQRPELKQLQALVEAACERHQREKMAPFVPSVLLGLSGGGFGGGPGGNIGSVDDRYDLDAVMTWEIRNLGYGEKSAKRRTAAQTQQATFKKMEMIDTVAREVSEAHSKVTHRKARIAITEDAIRSAKSSYDKNLSRIRDGEGLPIEALLSLKGLEAARLAYLDAVVAYNTAQFELQYAMGWQVSGRL